MESVIQKFRSSLGGFNRQDVMRYIEQTTAANRKKVAELEELLAKSEEERVRLEGELFGLRDEKGSVAAEEARVRASLEEATGFLTRMRGELSQTETKLAVSRAELERLQSQVGELEPMARSYGELKDRVATIELDAHRKAQATIDAANAEAEQVRKEAAEWLEQIVSQYGTLRSRMHAMCEDARSVAAMEDQLGQLDGLLADMTQKKAEEQ